MRWRYHLPQRAFPYADLVAENARRGKDRPEYELVDTGVFADDRFWVVTVDYAKAAPTDVRMRITVDNRGPDPATRTGAFAVPQGRHQRSRRDGYWNGQPRPGGHEGGLALRPGRAGRRDGAGAGAPVGDDVAPDLGAGYDEVLAARAAEADAFFATLTPATATADEARVLRQAVAAGPTAPDPAAHARRVAVSLGARATGLVRPAPGRALRLPGRRIQRVGALRTRRIRERTLWWELELAAASLVPGQLPADRGGPRRHRPGLGASHQTGWTALVADLLLRPRGEARSRYGDSHSR